MAKQISWLPCGRHQLQIHFAENPGEEAFRAACAVRQALEAQKTGTVRDYVIAPTAALVRVDPRLGARLKEWADELVQTVKKGAGSRLPRQHRKRLRVRYNGRDLKRVASLAKLPVEELIEIHMKATYYVCTIGGAPGFVSLGGLDPRLHLPAPDRPHARVRAGSIAVCGPDCFVVGVQQTGAWHVLAHTEEPPFDPGRDPPFLLEPCDLVRFTTAEEAAAKQES